MLQVVKYPDPILAQDAKECQLDSNALSKLTKQMLEVMYKYEGIGLAAPQIGLSLRLIVIDCAYELENIYRTADPKVLVNPKIIKHTNQLQESKEGCLSCPGVLAPVMRYKNVTVEYHDIENNKQKMDADGLTSNCLQHEIDHLNGKTIFQTCNTDSKIELLTQYNEALKQNIEPGKVL